MSGGIWCLSAKCSIFTTLRTFPATAAISALSSGNLPAGQHRSSAPAAQELFSLGRGSAFEGTLGRSMSRSPQVIPLALTFTY